MNIKRLLRYILKMGVESMVTSSTVSMGSFGVEKMPKSMREKR